MSVDVCCKRPSLLQNSGLSDPTSQVDLTVEIGLRHRDKMIGLGQSTGPVITIEYCARIPDKMQKLDQQTRQDQ